MATLLGGPTQATVVKRVVEESKHRLDLVRTHLLNMADRTALETLQEQSCVTWTPVQVSMPIYFHFQKLPWTLPTLFEMNLVPERQLVEIEHSTFQQKL